MASKNTHDYDIWVEDHFSLVLLRPYSDEADAWISENVADDAQFWAGALVVEPRYVDGILTGMQNDGLVIGNAIDAGRA